MPNISDFDLKDLQLDQGQESQGGNIAHYNPGDIKLDPVDPDAKNDSLLSNVPLLGDLNAFGSQVGRGIPVFGKLAEMGGNAVGSGIEAALSKDQSKSFLDRFKDAYARGEDQDRAEQKRVYSEHPVSATLGSMAGTLPLTQATVFSELGAPLPAVSELTAGMRAAGKAAPLGEQALGAFGRTVQSGALSALDAKLNGADDDTTGKALAMSAGTQLGLEALPFAGRAISAAASSPAARFLAKTAVGAGVGYLTDGKTGALSGAAMSHFIPKDSLSKLVTPENLQKVGKFAAPLIEAAKRGPTALAATHYVMSQTEPNYKAMSEDSSDEPK